MGALRNPCQEELMRLPLYHLSPSSWTHRNALIRNGVITVSQRRASVCEESPPEEVKIQNVRVLIPPSCVTVGKPVHLYLGDNLTKDVRWAPVGPASSVSGLGSVLIRTSKPLLYNRQRPEPRGPQPTDADANRVKHRSQGHPARLA